MGAKPIKVLVIGAGPGGLCLAQGLRAKGIAVAVFERRAARSERAHGYRLSLDAGGRAALEACLPPARFAVLLARAARPAAAVTFLDHRLRRLLGIDLRATSATVTSGDLPIGRGALERALLDGLDDVVRPGKVFSRFEDAPDGHVVARFTDGSSERGDVLVGADGASSRVRGQLLPWAERVETGILSVRGKLPLDDDVRAAIPATILLGPTLILGDHGRFLFADAVDHHALVDEVDGGEDHVVWSFSARSPAFALPGDPDTLDPATLRGAVAALMTGWHPALLRLVSSAPDASVSAFAVKTSVPIGPWATRNVTLLGDALHSMTPFRGTGANMALRDAAALSRALGRVESGEEGLLPALADFEREMIDDGFRAVRLSLREMSRLHADGALTRSLTKAMFRVADHLPALKGALHGG